MIRAIILDFDGVVLESVEVKTDAFRTLFSFCPESVDAIVSFHRQNGGMSRYDKFDYIYKNILREPLTKQKKQELSDKFSEIVFKKIFEAPFVPGACYFIKKNHTSIPLYIISATPEKELEIITSRRGLTPYFQEIYGSPRKKADCIRDILRSSGIAPSDIVFVGDAKNDLKAAKTTQIRFIGRVKLGEINIFAKKEGVEKVVTDLFDFAKYIEEIL